jgi:hypothetical protein
MQTHLTVQNPQASRPLRLPLTLDTNTDEKTVLANVLANSKHAKRWIKLVPDHDGIAVLVGGGPSAADHVGRIFDLQQFQRGKIFALNGAATFLAQHGIVPDYQVLMDARLESASLIGPAREHLFASQVDPECFRRIPDAILWHSTFGNLAVDEQDDFPDYDDDYCLIGSSVSVGPTALILLYALGYRTIHAFGVDCSHSEDGKESHAYRQSLNDGEPCTVETFNGKIFVCSVAMAYSAREFLRRGVELQKAGCAVHVHGSGYLPTIWNAKLSEREKYAAMWDLPEYRDFSPGEHAVEDFIREAKPEKGDRIIDFGCGTGRAALKLHDAGYVVTLVDFAGNCRDPEALDLPFVEADLTQPMSLSASYGFNADVLEHLPPESIEIAVRNMMACVPVCFFQISTVEDSAGALINQKLHLSVHPHEWWRSTFESLGFEVVHSHDIGGASQFLIKRKD